MSASSFTARERLAVTVVAALAAGAVIFMLLSHPEPKPVDAEAMKEQLRAVKELDEASTMPVDSIKAVRNARKAATRRRSAKPAKRQPVQPHSRDYTLSPDQESPHSVD